VRKRGRVDGNHSEIVKALRQAGVSVLSLADIGNGCPDLLCAVPKKTVLLEVKDPSQPPSKRRLTPDEQQFHDVWRGQIVVVETPEQALNVFA
jgi:Holliday junction resolvase